MRLILLRYQILFGNFFFMLFGKRILQMIKLTKYEGYLIYIFPMEHKMKSCVNNKVVL